LKQEGKPKRGTKKVGFQVIQRGRESPTLEWITPGKKGGAPYDTERTKKGLGSVGGQNLIDTRTTNTRRRLKCRWGVNIVELRS